MESESKQKTTSENVDNNELEEDDESLKCIFLSEFHATQGATLVLQHPKDYITKGERKFYSLKLFTRN